MPPTEGKGMYNWMEEKIEKDAEFIKVLLEQIRCLRAENYFYKGLLYDILVDIEDYTNPEKGLTEREAIINAFKQFKDRQNENKKWICK